MINKILDSKLFYIIVAVLASVLFWLYVTDESDDSTLRLNLPITFVGEESLQSRGLMMDKTGNEMLTVTFEGRRSVLNQLDTTNVKLQADVSSITSVGTQAIRCTPVYPSTVQSSSVSVDRSTLNIDVKVVRMTTKTVPVQGLFTGSLAENYWSDEITCSPNSIEISGEAELLEQVDHAVATIQRTDLTTSISENIAVTLVDKEDNVINSSSIQFSQETVLVTMPVGYIKEIPLTVELISGGGATDANARYEIEPKSVILAGDKALLDAYNTITLDPIDLSQVVSTATFERKIPISSELTNLSNVTAATVTVTVSGLATRTISVGADRIEFINGPEGYNVTAVNQSVSVLLRGVQESLDLVMENNIRIVANLENVSASAGTYKVSAAVYVDGFDDVGAVGEYKLIVSVKR